MRKFIMLMPLFLAGCAGATLPLELEQPTRCVYEVLRSSPGIEDPTVYYFKDYNAVIAFGYRGSKGEDQTTEIFVSLRPLDREPTAVGDYAADPNLSRLFSDRLLAQCHVNTGYTDEVMIMEDPHLGRWRVDMSKIEK
jgi:hypothetical protein